MTVRADITGRYANRMYAYEPADIKLCMCRSKTHSNINTQTCYYTLSLNVSFLFLSAEQHAES